MEHVQTALRRGLRRRVLAPLEPDAFLAWSWRTGPRRKGSRPLTVADWHFELSQHLTDEDEPLSVEEVRRDFVRLAARVRANQRLGRDPWDLELGTWGGIWNGR